MVYGNILMLCMDRLSSIIDRVQLELGGRLLMTTIKPQLRSGLQGVSVVDGAANN
jgi:hypothetical protein